jgi:ectoine hydroxylase
VDSLPQIELTRPDFLAGRNFDPLEVYENEEWDADVINERIY